MVDVTASTDRIEVRDDLGTDDAAKWSFWVGEDRIAGKEDEKWHKRGRKIIQRYRDERPQTGNSVHRLNILWANVQTLKPALYARTPKPDVQRRWLDQDDTGRLASVLLERALSYSLENSDFDRVMEAVVEDRLLPGRGVPRVMYIPHYGEELEPEAVEEFEDAEASPADVANPGDGREMGEPLRQVVYEEVIATYIFWEDYREGAARTWREVPWVRYRAYMNRDQLCERFGNKKGKRVNLDFMPKDVSQQNPDKGSTPPDIFKKAIVHEYWDRVKGKVVWLAPGTPDLILDEQDDPLGLPDFFPNPDPLMATTTNNTRIPVPDYVEYQDQADELDKLTARIDTLTRALKVSGVYPGSLKPTLQQLIDEGTENKLIPVEDWAAWMDKGGMDKFIQFMPLKEIAETLIQLYAAREQTKQLLYEITGIGDLMRGQTDPGETATAQQLKASFSTRRIQPQQRAVARMARDTIRLMAAVIAEHFSMETMSAVTGYPQLLPVPEIGEPPPQWLPAPPQQMAPPANDPGQAPPMPQEAPPTPALPEQAMAQLQEGRVARFTNGQRWTLENGQPRRVA